MDFNTLHKQRKFIMAAALIGLISMFLPWVSFMGYSTNGLHGSGFLILFAFIGAGVLAYLGDQKSHLSKTAWLATLACGAFVVLFWVINFFDAVNAISLMGIGYWLCVIAGGALVAVTYMFRDPNQNLKESLNEMKKTVENKVDNNPNT